MRSPAEQRWRDEHREQILANDKKYHALHRDKRNAERRRRYREHNEAMILRERRKTQREKVNAANRRSYQNLRARRLAEKAAYYQRTRTEREKYKRRKHATDPSYAISCRLRTRIWHALRKQWTDKAGRFRDLVGCSPRELCKYLETLFSDGMTWDNRALWHVDHIKPCRSFDLTDPAQQRLCFHYTNLQPLWREQNLRKGGR